MLLPGNLSPTLTSSSPMKTRFAAVCAEAVLFLAAMLTTSVLPAHERLDLRLPSLAGRNRQRPRSVCARCSALTWRSVRSAGAFAIYCSGLTSHVRSPGLDVHTGMGSLPCIMDRFEGVTIAATGRTRLREIKRFPTALRTTHACLSLISPWMPCPVLMQPRSRRTLLALPSAHRAFGHVLSPCGANVRPVCSRAVLCEQAYRSTSRASRPRASTSCSRPPLCTGTLPATRSLRKARYCSRASLLMVLTVRITYHNLLLHVRDACDALGMISRLLEGSILRYVGREEGQHHTRCQYRCV